MSSRIHLVVAVSCLSAIMVFAIIGVAAVTIRTIGDGRSTECTLMDAVVGGWSRNEAKVIASNTPQDFVNWLDGYQKVLDARHEACHP